MIPCLSPTRGRRPFHSTQHRGVTNMKKLILALAIVLAGGASIAQTTEAVKESGKAVAEKAKEGKENVQAAATSDPKKKATHKAKAKAHKAKALKHDAKAKAAGEQIGK